MTQRGCHSRTLRFCLRWNLHLSRPLFLLLPRLHFPLLPHRHVLQGPLHHVQLCRQLCRPHLLMTWHVSKGEHASKLATPNVAERRAKRRRLLGLERYGLVNPSDTKGCTSSKAPSTRISSRSQQQASLASVSMSWKSIVPFKALSKKDLKSLTGMECTSARCS